MFLTALLIGMSAAASAAPLTVSQCGADPTGQTDSTSAFTSCLTKMPEGDVIVPAGIYKINGTISKDRNHNLIGVGSKASVLQCHSSYAPCIVAADTTAGPTNYAESRLEDLTIEGPGTGNTSIGVFFGGDPGGHFNAASAYGEAVDLLHVRITNFNRGVEWGNNAWSNKIVQSQIFGNSVGIYTPTGLSNSGENLGITDSSIFNNSSFGIDDHASFEWMISGSAFDFNGTAIEFFGSTIHAINSHFEQSAGFVVSQPYGMGVLSIRDSEILLDASQGTDQYLLNTWPQSLVLAIDDVSIWSNHQVQNFMKVQGNIVGVIINLYGNGNKMIKKLSDQPSAVTLTAIHAF